MFRPLLTTALLLTTYWVNYLSSSGQFGQTMMYLREVFPFPYMPAGWTFAVARTAIYLTLGLWCIWSWTPQWKSNETNKMILPRFWISSVLNIFWIFATAREWYAISVIIIAMLMIVLWKILAVTSQFRKNHEFHRWAIVSRNAFGLYAWRITVATTIVGVSQLVYTLVNQQRPLTTRWTICVLLLWVSTALYIYYKFRNPSQLLITLFALAGIMASLFG